MYTRYFLKNCVLDMATGLENVYRKAPNKSNRAEPFYVLLLLVIFSKDDAYV